MYKSIQMENFRGFRRLEIHGLKRINLFTGKNSVGKTSLLEATFLGLAPNNPSLTLVVNALRSGSEKMLLDAEFLWGALFYKRDITKTIKLTMTCLSGGQREIKITLVEPESRRVLPQAPEKEPSVSLSGRADSHPMPTRLLLKFNDELGKEEEAHLTVADSELNVRDGSKENRPPVVLMTSRPFDPGLDSRRFSKIVDRRRKDVLLNALRVVEPRLIDLQLTYHGDPPMVAADIGIGPLLPVSYLGEGLRRLMSNLLAITDAENGTALIDEMENGFHHSILGNVWKALIRAAEDANTQLFLTTHSFECIQAAAGVLRELDYRDFCTYRLERSNDDVRAIVIEREAFESAVEFDMEIR